MLVLLLHVVSDYIISILFTILGISGVVFNINKSAYQIENGCELEYIEDKPFDEQVKILEAIFAKYDAFSRDKSVPETIIFSELKARNKFKFILTEEKDTRNEIHCVAGSYEDGYYLGAEDAFYCNDCASSLGLN